MGITLPLDKMTVAGKLEAMEALWNDLSQNPKNISSPEWHGQVLQNREEDIKNDKDKLSDCGKE
jgi:hypothetical protein